MFEKIMNFTVAYIDSLSGDIIFIIVLCLLSLVSISTSAILMFFVEKRQKGQKNREPKDVGVYLAEFG